MKANGTPEKIYLSSKQRPDKEIFYVFATPVENDDIEYTLTDAFIEKACKWIKEFNNHHHIMRYSDSCEPPLSEITEWFKNYMKGEEYGKCI